MLEMDFFFLFGPFEKGVFVHARALCLLNKGWGMGGKGFRRFSRVFGDWIWGLLAVYVEWCVCRYLWQWVGKGLRF